MFNKRMQYVIKSVPTNDRQALEDLLNNMSTDGWDLYTMHELESDDNIEFNCIFMRERQDEDDDIALDDIVNVTSFKHRMEKMLAAPASPYESCKELQLKITNIKDKIKSIKSQLESDDLDVDTKNQLNIQMSDELKNLNSLKQALVNEISPDAIFSTVKEEKFTVDLSEEILGLVSNDSPENLLAETVRVRQELVENLGYVIPHVYFHNSDSLNQNEFSIKIHDVEVCREIVLPGYRAFFKNDLENYKPDEDDILVHNELFDKKVLWINENKVKDFWVKGLSAIEYIGEVIKHVAIKEVSDIMDYNDINRYIEIVLKSNSFLIDNIIPDYLTASDLKYLLSCLVREKVSIKNIIYLFEKINDYANEPTKDDLLDKVRLAFSKLIIKDLAQDGLIKAISISDETYDIVSSFFNQDDDSAIIRIDASDVEKIASKIRKITKSKKLKQPILVVPMELRHMMFVILSEFVPSITVIANEELADNADVKYIGMI
ncbi:flagellar biosynthesis protein FlhA [bacterium]|nr:flagellar biosynthesis protein FlhA [bacterium]